MKRLRSVDITDESSKRIKTGEEEEEKVPVTQKVLVDGESLIIGNSTISHSNGDY